MLVSPSQIGVVTLLQVEVLDEGAVYAAQQLAKRQVYASALMKFHILGSDDAKVKKIAGELV